MFNTSKSPTYIYSKGATSKVEHPDRKLPARMTRSDVKEGARFSQAWLSKQSMTKERDDKGPTTIFEDKEEELSLK